MNVILIVDIKNIQINLTATVYQLVYLAHYSNLLQYLDIYYPNVIVSLSALYSNYSSSLIFQ